MAGAGGSEPPSAGIKSGALGRLATPHEHDRRGRTIPRRKGFNTRTPAFPRVKPWRGVWRNFFEFLAFLGASPNDPPTIGHVLAFRPAAFEFRIEAKGFQNRIYDRFRVKARRLDLQFRFILVHENIGHRHGTNFQTIVQQSLPRHPVDNMASESAGRTFLHKNQDLVFFRQGAHQIPIKRFCEPGVGDGRAQTLWNSSSAAASAARTRVPSPRIATQEPSKNAALADFQTAALRRKFDADALPRG